LFLGKSTPTNLTMFNSFKIFILDVAYAWDWNKLP